MRVGIDLRACQDERIEPAARQAALEFAHALADGAGALDLRILLSDRSAHMIPRLRRALPALHAAQRIAVIAEAAIWRGAMDSGRAAAAAALVWDAGVRAQQCDCMLQPMARIADGTHAVTLTDVRVFSAVAQVIARDALADPVGAAALAITEIARRLAADAVPAEPLRHAMGARRRLAFVSPLPPEKTGVAAYNAKLLPALAMRYDIDVVTDQAHYELPVSSGAIRVVSVAEFVDAYDAFDRVLYHMGNSPFHAHVPGLVRDYPGTVVMHDVFLGDLMNWLDGSARPSGVLQKSLLEGHGYGAATLLARRVKRDELARRFECNSLLLDEADGVIVHSAFAAAHVRTRFADDVDAPVAIAALCRPVAAGVDRGPARRRLGIGDGEFVMSSFGFVNHVKLHREIVTAWTRSRMAKSPAARLVIVGQGQGDAYHVALQAQIAAVDCGSPIVITGYVDDAAMADYLAASDVAVQLRSETRGESSGAALDCMAFGLPLITNRCGALAEIPEHATVSLAVDFTIADLTAAMESLHDDGVLRERLARAARDVVATRHDPDFVARRYAEAIERFHDRGPRARYARTLAALAPLCADDKTHDGVDDAAVDAVARALAQNLRRPGVAQLLVDVTPLVDEDLKTGIERVVRSVLQRLVDVPPPGMRVEPVRFVGGRFVYARRFMSRWLGLVHEEEDFEVEPRRGDHFLGLAWSPHAIPLAQQALRHYRDIGVRITFVVYDLLPLGHPNWFPPGLAEQHRGWLLAAASTADRLIAISATVAGDLLAWLESCAPDRDLPVAVAHFALGSDIEASVSTLGVPPSADSLIDAMSARPTLLMVGTVEPRKGHRQAIEAFADLWQAGHDVALVIVGKRGWMTADVELLIAGHEECGRRLVRLDSVSDEFLQQLYHASKAVLVASFGEGFGLPIVEAARHGVPVIARDIPVFREVAGDGAHYFHGNAPADLAQAIIRWLALAESGAHPSPARIRVNDWAESASLLMDAVAGNADVGVWSPPASSRPLFAREFAECEIDFSAAAWPRCVAAVAGLSARESWGRWSDAKISSSVLVEFCRPLPPHVRLLIIARAFGPNCEADICVTIGTVQRRIRLGPTDTTIVIDVDTDCSPYAITLTPPAPLSPADLGLYDDARKLGIGLVRLEVRELPTDALAPADTAFSAAEK